MAKHNTNSKEGFTIIEVVLVLAIAGLIFLMVFVALPALQRSQRDTQRRNDMSRVDTSLVQYQTNNSSAADNLPTGPSLYIPSTTSNEISAGTATGGGSDSSKTKGVAQSFIQRYMNSGTDSATNTFEDPDGVLYSMYITDNYSGGTLTTDLSAAKLVPQGSGYTVGTDFDKHIIYVVPGGECNGEIVVSSTKRHFAILYRLEGAGVYCIDDQ